MPSRFLRILSFSLLAILLAMPVTALAQSKLITSTGSAARGD